MGSIIAGDMEYCFFGGRPAESHGHQFTLFGSSNRLKADEDRLNGSFCYRCHTTGPVTMRISR